MSSSNKAHFVTGNFEKSLRANARSQSKFICPKCGDSPAFGIRAQLFEHAKSSHPEVTSSATDVSEWESFVQDAISKACVTFFSPLFFRLCRDSTGEVA